MSQRTAVRLPDDLIKRAKHRPAAEERSLTSLIEDGLRRVLDEQRPVGTARRILPPVSKVTGA